MRLSDLKVGEEYAYSSSRRWRDPDYVAGRPKRVRYLGPDPERRGAYRIELMGVGIETLTYSLSAFRMPWPEWYKELDAILTHREQKLAQRLAEQRLKDEVLLTLAEIGIHQKSKASHHADIILTAGDLRRLVDLANVAKMAGA